jgi:hypothetical protein
MVNLLPSGKPTVHDRNPGTQNDHMYFQTFAVNKKFVAIAIKTYRV